MSISVPQLKCAVHIGTNCFGCDVRIEALPGARCVIVTSGFARAVDDEPAPVSTAACTSCGPRSVGVSRSLADSPVAQFPRLKNAAGKLKNVTPPCGARILPLAEKLR